MSTTQGNTSNEHYSSDVAELQKTLKDALAKNQQWLAYNQQREAYVRTVVDRMLWLDNQLDQAVRARLTQHNKEHSEEEERVREMKEHFESLLVIGRDNLLIVKQRLDITLQDLAETKNRVEEKEMEARELKQQLRRCSKDKELLMNEIRVLHGKLGEEKQRSAKLERQRMQQEEDYEEEEGDEEPVYEEMRPCRPSSESILDASTLHCPICRIQCPVSQYRQMMDHLEVCMN